MNDTERINLLKNAMSSYRARHRDGALWQQLSAAEQEEFLFTAWTDTAAFLGGEPDLERTAALNAVLEQALYLARRERQPERPRLVSETVEGLGSRRYSEKGAAAQGDSGNFSPRAKMFCLQLIRERQITLTRG